MRPKALTDCVKRAFPIVITLLAAVLFAALPSPAAERQLFDTARFIATDFDPSSSVTADFDGDGDTDLAITHASYTSNSGVAILLNDGQGGFEQQILIVEGVGGSIETVDVDNDGDMDLACSKNDELQIFKNNGLGQFWAAQVSYTGQLHLQQMTHGDFDGDGHQDLAAVTSSWQNIVLVLWGSGNGLFESYLPLILEDELVHAEAADLDEDGLVDLVVSTDYEGLFTYISQGGRTFSNGQPLGPGEDPDAMQAADLDQDGHTDVVIASWDRYPYELVFFWGNGNGQFPETSRREYDASSGRLSICDPDHDGDPDLVLTRSAAEEICVLLNQGGRAFTEAPRSVLSGDAYRASCLDADGDGFLDLVGLSDNVSTSDSGLMVIRGLGDGTFVSPRRTATVDDCYYYLCQDLDLDGNVDLVISRNDYYQAEIRVRFGNGDGTFGDPTIYNVDENLERIRLADLNLDGHPDLLGKTYYDNRYHVEVRLGASGGVFGNMTEVGTIHPSSGFAVGDLNLDGIADMAISSSQDGLVSVLTGNGDGTFEFLTDLTGLGVPFDILIEDFNEDGLPDLAVYDNNYSTDEVVHIFPGNGDGTFGAPQQFEGDFNTSRVLTGDLDGDGHFDIVFDTGYDHSISVLMGHGDGTFGDLVTTYRDTPVGDFLLGDPDGDGTTELIATQTYIHTVGLFAVDGGGAATLESAYGVSRNNGLKQLADVDNDGDLDLLAFAYSAGDAGSLWVINNNSAGSFLAAGPGPGPQNPPRVRLFDTARSDLLITQWDAYAAGGYGVNSAIGDLDGDGRPEVVTGPGPGAIYGPHVRGFRSSGAPIPAVSYLAYGTNRYGVNVALGDLDDDGYAEIVTGAGPGAVFGPHVRGWNWDGSGAPQPIPGLSFFAYGTPKYGVNVACGDIDGDGIDEIVTGAGPGAVYGPHVRGWNVDGGGAAPISSVSFMAYGTLKYGVNVACGDIDGDGIDEMVTGAGPGTVFYPHVRAWNWDGGGAVASISAVSFIAYNLTQWGVNVSCGDLDGDGIDEILTGPGPGPTHWARVRGWNYDGTVLAPMANLDFDAFDGVVPGYGVKVAGARH